MRFMWIGIVLVVLSFVIDRVPAQYVPYFPYSPTDLIGVSNIFRSISKIARCVGAALIGAGIVISKLQSKGGKDSTEVL